MKVHPHVRGEYLADGIPDIRIDPVQLEQILTNLIMNARDAVGENAGSISVSTAARVFDRKYCAENPDYMPGKFVRLSVADDGCGIDPKLKSKIFEPFFTTRPLGEGIGLGLATIFGIVKQNHGFIDFESAPGKGARFNIYLPAHEDEPAEAAPSEPAADTADTAGQLEKTVLLVDDEPGILKITASIVRSLGYSVLSTSSANKAVAIATAADQHIDLLLTDLVMPEMHGSQLADKIAQYQPGIAVIYMSGYSDDVLRDDGVLISVSVVPCDFLDVDCRVYPD